MAVPSVTLPALECPDVLLPTPANLSNLFGGLATMSYRYPDELADLKANPKRYAYGTVVEGRLDKGRGPVATLLVEPQLANNIIDAVIVKIEIVFFIMYLIY